MIVVGWILFVWLILSIIYSTWFHLSNYFKASSTEALYAIDLEFPGQNELFDKKVFLRKVLSFQIAKFIIVLIIGYFLFK